MYESKSGGIVDTLNGVLEKAEGHLDSATKAETAAKNKCDLLKQSLGDEIKYANKGMETPKRLLQIPVTSTAGPCGSASKSRKGCWSSTSADCRVS